MHKIGIGIPTYNRRASLQRLIQQIRSTISSDYDLFVSVDGSTDDTISWLQQNNVPFEWHENRGIGYTKNVILKRFKCGYPYIFIIEDDMIIKRPGVFDLYIKAMQTFGIHHFNFLVPEQRQYVLPPTRKNGLTLRYSSLLGGTFMFLTDEVIKRVGGFNPRFIGYGYEHCEYTLRVAKAGLTTPWQQFAHIQESEEYLEHISHEKDESYLQRIHQSLSHNSRILNETLSNDVIYIPIPE